MITLRRAHQRRYERQPWQEAWLTFYAQEQQEELADGFGTLESLNEGRFPPRAGILLPQKDAEILTYVCEGTLAYQDSMGRSGVIRSGEFQRMTTGGGMRYGEANASSTDWAHVFQFHLRPAGAKLAPGHEQKLFSAAERRGGLCVVASQDGQRGSLRIHQDALLFSAILDRGQHIVHELREGRGAWLHIVRGEATLGAVTLNAGDGVGILAEPAVSLTALENTEILLFEFGKLASSSSTVKRGASRQGSATDNGQPRASRPGAFA